MSKKKTKRKATSDNLGCMTAETPDRRRYSWQQVEQFIKDKTPAINLLDQFNQAKQNLEMDRERLNDCQGHFENLKDKVAKSTLRVEELAKELLLSVREVTRH